MTEQNKWPADKVQRRSISDLVPYSNNSRTHSDKQIDQIAASIKEWGWTIPVLIDEQNGIIAGHARVKAAQKLKIKDVPCIVAAGWSKAQRKAYLIADNKLAENADWDEDLLALELEDLTEFGFEIDLLGFDEEEIGSLNSQKSLNIPSDIKEGALRERYGVPPFSVLSARDGNWQNRKKMWRSFGVESESGRPEALLFKSVTSRVSDYYTQKSKIEARLGKNISNSEFENKFLKQTNNSGISSGVSVFDPVLTEICYLWFSPKNGTVLDPFAGGSVRGIVAAYLGLNYTGVDLRQEQINANRKQASNLKLVPTPNWIQGDSRDIETLCKEQKADLIFSCPPYVDLEKYSEDPADLSSLKYDDFKIDYSDIIDKSCRLLKDHSFAVFVVAEVRDKEGNYYNFVGDTVQAFKNAGLAYYNEAILVTQVGSLPIRVGRQFATGRKLGKTHQNILVFVKGDAKKAALRCNIDLPAWNEENEVEFEV